MPGFKNLPLLVSAILIFISCNNNNPAGRPDEKINLKTVYRIPYDTLTDDIAGFIAGMEHGKSDCLARLDSVSGWKRFAFTMDSGFRHLDTSRFVKMKRWADREINNRYDNSVLFYPFSGPDILNASIFYPNAGEYVLFGLEPVGDLPDLCNMTTDQVNEYLDDAWYSLHDIFMRSYFITGNMISDLKKKSLKGTLPVMVIFLKRMGYNIVSINKIAVDSAGNPGKLADNKQPEGSTSGVRIEFAGDTGRIIQTLYYFRADISDEGLRKNKGFASYLSGLDECHTYIKAASYLMHADEFSSIRNLVFKKSRSILQDDSGIAYRLFDKNIWDISLYGKYHRPGKEFSWINETDLAQAYKDTSIKPVPFTLGYNWRTRAINLLYAERKKAGN